jgi:hypothetical protein
MKRTLQLLFVFVVLLSACAKSGIGGGGDSGVLGVVQAGPQCPVERVGSPCPDRPFPGTVRATSVDGASSEVNTDGQGRFRLALTPGTYVLTVVTATGPPPSAIPQTVQVKAGAFTQATLEVDTGIR